MATYLETTNIQIYKFRSGKTNKIFFMFKYERDGTLWMETTVLSAELLQCGRREGVKTMGTKILGKSREFLPTEWIINEWEGDIDIVNVIKNFCNKIEMDGFTREPCKSALHNEEG